MLVVDDDPSFGKILGRIAEQSGVVVTYCRDREEVARERGKHFDAAIVDFDLGEDSGLDILREYFPENSTPVLLVSQSQMVEVPLAAWPASVVGFLQKSIGHFAILEAALAAHESAVTVASQKTR